MKNPFLGMNPYLEQHWGDVHARLTIYVADQLQAKLPQGLVARAEERIAIGESDRQYSLRPDVHISELKEPQQSVLADPPDDSGISVAEPVVIVLEPDVHRWVEIRDKAGRLITVIEVLSPTNKSDTGQVDYRRRQHTYISGGVNLVEIDLLRGGECVLSLPNENIPDRCRTPYSVCIYRASEPGQREFYPIALRQRLPAIRLPLRPTDRDAVLELQPLIEQVYERGRYETLNYDRDLDPPLSEPDRIWVDEVLRTSGLRS